jgi:hypothetical protein
LTVVLVLAIIDPVLDHLTRRPFALEPLIAEAKRRMRRRRLLLVIVIAALVVGAAVGGVFAAGSPGGSGGGGGAHNNGNNSGAEQNQPASFKAPAKAPVTAAMVTAAHRDETKLLGLFVAPPGAQRLAHPPASLRRLRTQIFGVYQKRFIRYAYWRVRASVAAVTAFEKAHRPAGADPVGCPGMRGKEARLCGVGRDTGPNIPANASLVFTFPRIHGLVSSRELRMGILRLPGGWTAIQLVADNHTWIPYRFRNHAPPPPQMFFVAAHHSPVAGQMFTGVTVIDEDPQISPLVRVSCGGVLGHHALLGRQHVFSATPPPGRAGALARFEKAAKVEEVTCSWQIPAGTAGERLRLGSGRRDGARVATYTAGTRTTPAETISSPEYSWTVRP